MNKVRLFLVDHYPEGKRQLGVKIKDRNLHEGRKHAASVAEMDNDALVQEFASRVDLTTKAMLASAPDAALGDIEATNLTLVTVTYGTVRNALERGPSAGAAEELLHQLIVMCQAYLRSVAAKVNAGCPAPE